MSRWPEELFVYEGQLYPDYLKRGGASRFIAPIATRFCVGNGVDVGAGMWPLPGATPVEMAQGGSAYDIPGEGLDFVFSSHCLEHLDDPVTALCHWRDKLKDNGVLFLYLPHPDMIYWRPENCRKHRHLFYPKDVVTMLARLGFKDIIHSERDLAWSFAVVGFRR